MNTKKIVVASLSAVLMVGIAAPSFAASARTGHGPRAGAMQERMFVRLLKAADTDKDAKITKDEFTAWQDARFTEIDADKDGILIPGEFRSFRKAKWDEFRKNNPRPDRAGQDKDASKDQAQNESDRNDGPRHRDRRHGHRFGMHGARHMGGMHLIRMADTDENGQLSKAEATAAADKLFTRMDRNKDGTISIDDMPNRPF